MGMKKSKVYIKSVVAATVFIGIVAVVWFGVPMQSGGGQDKDEKQKVSKASSTVTIEPMMAVVQQQEDMFVKVTRSTDSPIDRDLGVVLMPVEKEDAQDASLYDSTAIIPKGEMTTTHQIIKYPWREREEEASRKTISYKVVECRTPYYGLCEIGSCYSDTPAPCKVASSDVVTFQMQPKIYDSVVTIKPVQEQVRDKESVVFEIVRDGDVSEYLGVNVYCNSVGYHAFPGLSSTRRGREPRVKRIFIPAGQQSIQYPFVIDNEYATNVECSIISSTGKTFSEAARDAQSARVWIIDGLPKVGMSVRISDSVHGVGLCEEETKLPQHIPCEKAVREGDTIVINIRRVGDTSYPLTVAVVCTAEHFVLGKMPFTVTIPTDKVYAGGNPYTDDITIRIQKDGIKSPDGPVLCSIQRSEEYDVISKNDPRAIFGISQDQHRGDVVLWVVDDD